MTLYEMQSVIESASSLDMRYMETADQLIYISAISELAEKVKPLVVKYSNELPQESKFLFRM